MDKMKFIIEDAIVKYLNHTNSDKSRLYYGYYVKYINIKVIEEFENGDKTFSKLFCLKTREQSVILCFLFFFDEQVFFENNN